MKTPEEIKNGLKCHTQMGNCAEECPYDDPLRKCQSRCIHDMFKDSLALIIQLEADREALLKIAHDYAGCSECINVDNKPELPPCCDCGVLGKNWVWRGAGKEETNENA